MAPGAIVAYVSDGESSSSLSQDAGSDIDDVPVIKHKVPLNVQFKAAAPHAVATDIDWVPSRKTYMDRVSRRLKEGIPSTPLPAGFPASAQNGPCWSKSKPKQEDLVFYLDNKGTQEIQQALSHFKGLGLSKDDISPKTFPLPSLSSALKSMSENVHNGHGVSIVRGLNPLNYSFEDNVILYAGISSYIGGTRGKQDPSGNILVHIKDVGSTVAPDNLRQSPYANNAQPFHNDLGDMIALYCMDKARVGGVSRLASAAAVYNELATHRPDLVSELAAPNWAFDRNDGSQTYDSRPILFHDPTKGRTFFNFSRRQLTGSTVSPRPSYLPKLTEAQAEALDAVHFTADKHAINIQLERGDIQFSNNLALFHAREAFQDGEDSNQRHMIRMWLRNEQLAWPTPPELERVWNEVYGDERESLWYMSPTHTRAHVINRSLSCHG